MWTFRNKVFRQLRRQRGVILLIFVIVVVGGVFTGSLIYDTLGSFDSIAAARTDKNRRTLQAARDSLIAYMLLRADRPFNIARPIDAPIVPRLLMLPCPDNLGDNNLDGSQDPTCGANGSRGDMVNGILNSGSRFGRLPYKTNTTPQTAREKEINDGLGADFRDAHGHRLWYAVSQNMVPATNNAPLNLHRLAVVSNNWLTVFAAEPTAQITNGLTVTRHQLRLHSKRVAAVVLSPGKNKPGRRAEELITRDVLNPGDVSATAYFESLAGESNADRDGVFVESPPVGDFDDSLAYIDMDTLLLPHGCFVQNYSAAAGIDNVHNAPLPHSPLAEVRESLVAWKNFFGFYPSPAANTAGHVNTRFRHCDVVRSPAPTAGQIAAAHPLLLPVAVTVAASAAAGVVTVSLQTDSGFLTAQPTTISAMILARYARLTLTAGAPLLVDAALLQAGANGRMLPAGVTVSTAAVIGVSLPASVLLAPTIQSGWLPEHYRTTMSVAKDGSKLNLAAPTTIGFLESALLTTAMATITVSPADRLVLSAGVLKVEQDFSQLTNFLYQTAVLNYADGSRQTLAAESYHPTPATYHRRRLVALLLSDTAGHNAPFVVYPWRKKSSAAAVSRDNLHPYPPCFDSRRLSRPTRTFIENQNIHYAVAPACQYGAPANCGRHGGITLKLAANARIAAAEPFVLTLSYTVTLANDRVTVRNGVASRDLTVRHDTTIPVAGGRATAHINLTAGFVFTGGGAVTIAAGSEITGGGYLDKVQALLIYSPAPLLNVACNTGMTNSYTARGRTVSAQGEDNANLNNMCEWLDDEENADGDLSYVLRAPAARAPPTNDFFMVFGGRLVLD